MKKLFLVLAVIAMCIGARAQFYAGGTLGLDVVHVYVDGGSSATSSTIAIAPEFGYSFNKTWAIGAQVGYGFTSSGGDLTTFTVMPYVRGTFARAGIVDFFGEFGVGYGHQSTEDDGVSGTIFSLNPGIAVNFTPKFALIARTSLFQFEYWDGLGIFDFSVNKNFVVGVQFKF